MWRRRPNYYAGPFSAQAEYTVSAVTALAGATKAELRNRGWQASVGYVLTGESASYNGYVPEHNFDPESGTWGAWEVGAHIANLKIDSNAFPVFADPAASANEATSYGASVTWFLSKAIRVSFDLVQTHFDRAPGSKSTTNPPHRPGREGLPHPVSGGFLNQPAQRRIHPGASKARPRAARERVCSPGPISSGPGNLLDRPPTVISIAGNKKP